MADLKIKIDELPKGIPTDSDIIPYVDLANNETKKATKAELKGDKGDNASVDVDSTITGNAGTSALVENVGDTQNARFKFTIPRGDKGEAGDEIELENDGTNIRWRLGTGAWSNLASIASLKGADGKEIELQVTATNIEWKYAGGSWTPLIALSALKGDKGDAATVTVDSTVTGAAGTNASVTNTGTSSAASFKFTIPRGDKGEAGDDGEEITLENDGTNIRWRLGSGAWNTLVSVASLKGADGTDGKEVELESDGTNIRWRLTGGVWANLVSIASLKGDKGDGATITVGQVDTVDPTDPATVTNVGTSGDAIFDFEIPKGLKGDTGDTGDSFYWKGAYDGSTEYKEGEAVEYNRSSYMAKTTTTGNLPTNTTYWDLMAQKGADGLGSGDMLKATYDPNEVEGDAFDMDNMTEGANNKLVSGAEKTTWSGKQDALNYTPEDSLNKKTDLTDNSDTYYPTQKAVKTAVDGKQDTMTKASYGDLNTGTDDAKYLTAKSVADSDYIKESDIRNTQSIVSNSSITPTGSYSQNEVYITALAEATTINAPSGTPVNGNTLLIRIKDAGTKKGITWNAIYSWLVDKPEETIDGVMYIGAIYNSTSNKWEVVSIND